MHVDDALRRRFVRVVRGNRRQSDDQSRVRHRCNRDVAHAVVLHRGEVAQWDDTDVGAEVAWEVVRQAVDSRVDPVDIVALVGDGGRAIEQLPRLPRMKVRPVRAFDQTANRTRYRMTGVVRAHRAKLQQVLGHAYRKDNTRAWILRVAQENRHFLTSRRRNRHARLVRDVQSVALKAVALQRKVGEVGALSLLRHLVVQTQEARRRITSRSDDVGRCGDVRNDQLRERRELELYLELLAKRLDGEQLLEARLVFAPRQPELRRISALSIRLVRQRTNRIAISGGRRRALGVEVQLTLDENVVGLVSSQRFSAVRPLEHLLFTADALLANVRRVGDGRRRTRIAAFERMQIGGTSIDELRQLHMQLNRVDVGQAFLADVERQQLTKRDR